MPENILISQDEVSGTFHILSVPEADANQQEMFLRNPGLVYDKLHSPDDFAFIYHAVQV
jgi:hypothetical protein